MGVCRGLNMDADDNGAIRFHFNDFLYGTRRLRGKEWKLVKQPLVDGYASSPKIDSFVSSRPICRTGSRRSSPWRLPRPCCGPSRITSWSYGRSWKPGVLNSRPPTSGRFASPTSLRACKSCWPQSSRAKTSPIRGRFALVAFLNNLGLSAEGIYRIFASVLDFRERIPRYQIEHIAGEISGKIYTAPECSTMKSYGICPVPDRLCQTISHPLSYYRVKNRRTKASGKTPSRS